MKTLLAGSFVGLTVIVILDLCIAPSADAQALQANGGDQTMAISTAIAGGQPLAVVNTSCSLRYMLRFQTQEITVSTSCPGQSYDLTVVATNVTKGSAAPQVTLINGDPATDLITSIPLGFFSYATCTLQFTASATFDEGNSTESGDDVHTVTYTILKQ